MTGLISRATRPSGSDGLDPARRDTGAPTISAMEPTSGLVGRSQQIGRLARVLVGDRRAVVVEGDAGVGKTALLGELRRHGRADGWKCVLCECVEAEREFSYA